MISESLISLARRYINTIHVYILCRLCTRTSIEKEIGLKIKKVVDNILQNNITDANYVNDPVALTNTGARQYFSDTLKKVLQGGH